MAESHTVVKWSSAAGSFESTLLHLVYIYISSNKQVLQVDSTNTKKTNICIVIVYMVSVWSWWGGMRKMWRWFLLINNSSASLHTLSELELEFGKIFTIQNHSMIVGCRSYRDVICCIWFDFCDIWWKIAYYLFVTSRSFSMMGFWIVLRARNLSSAWMVIPSLYLGLIVRMVIYLKRLNPIVSLTGYIGIRLTHARLIHLCSISVSDSICFTLTHTNKCLNMNAIVADRRRKTKAKVVGGEKY